MIAHRLDAQLLTSPSARTPEAVVERLLAVQAQDNRGARLAIRARSTGLTAADVDSALTRDRTLVVSWLNRGTLHLVRSEDYFWLHALTAPQQATANARRLAQEGVSPDAAERGVAVVERALADDGPQTRAALRDRLEAAGVPVEGQALIHVLAAAARRGTIVRGPMVGAQQAWVLVRDWLGEPPRVDRDRALGELGRRYLAGHGPADARDLARWAAITLTDARRALGAARPPAAAQPPPPPPPKLLGAFEPLLLGWADRAPVTGSHTRLVTVNGVFRPFVLAGGRAAGAWRLERRRVEVEWFDGEQPVDVGAEAADVLRFLGLT